MPKRLAPSEHRRIYRRLIDRDGAQCEDCGVTPEKLEEKLTIDHVDEDSGNWVLSNLALRCRPCNTAKSNRLRPRRGGSSKLVSGDCVRERAKDRVQESGMAAARRYAIDSASGSPEMQANNLYERSFRRWLIEYLEGHGSITKKEAVNSGAEFTGGSTTTMGRYLDKLTSMLGPLMLSRDDAGIEVIVLKQ